MPVLEAIEEYRTSCGVHAWEALPHIARLLAAARRHRLPVFYTLGRSGSGTTKRKAGQSPQEATALAQADHEFPPEVSPRAGERVIVKPMASAFFNTGLGEELRSLGVDCLLVGGTSTCGCVRASVVDGHSLGFAMFVVEECCFDRSRFSHLVSLFDMNAKYATVITLDQALAHLERLPTTTSARG